MSKYIGTKAVNLSTTSADVTGNADIDGNLTVGGDLTVSGTTITVDHATAQTVDLGDNDKIRLGDGNDLQIYHDGQHSIIQDAGTGDLRLYGNNVKIKNADNTAAYIQGINGAEVNLYYNNALKLATTSTGVDITGQVDVNSAARIDSNGIVKAASGTEAAPTHSFLNDPDNGMFRATTNTIGFSTGGSEAMRINSSGNVTVGTEDDAVWNDTTGDGGVNLRSDGILAAARNGGEPLLLNRIGTDGELIKFKKNGADVGEIGNTGTRLYLGSGDVGAAFQSDVDKRFYPIDPSNGGTGKDAYIDLGRNNVRWKDLYLSNDVKLFETSYTAGTHVDAGLRHYYKNGAASTLYDEDAAIEFVKVDGFDTNWTHGAQIHFKTTENNRDAAPVSMVVLDEKGNISQGNVSGNAPDAYSNAHGLTIIKQGTPKIALENYGVRAMGIHGAGSSSVNSGIVIYDESGATEIARFRRGGGITFNGDTAAANALDDYEEGTFSPTTDTKAYIYYASYTKVGQLVTINTCLQVKSGQSVATISLPFLPRNTSQGGNITSQANNRYGGHCTYFTPSGGSAPITIHAFHQGNQGSSAYFIAKSATNTQSWTYSLPDSLGNIAITMTYVTDS